MNTCFHYNIDSDPDVIYIYLRVWAPLYYTGNTAYKCISFIVELIWLTDNGILKDIGTEKVVYTCNI